MLFDGIQPAPPDAILGVTEAFRKDPRPFKINLGVGVYMDDAGATPVLQCVRRAEQQLARNSASKSYLPIAGLEEYNRFVQELVLGAHAAHGGTAHTAQTPGGTGALRVGAEFLRARAGARRVWLSAPTWANHRGIFTAAGFEVVEYPYYRAASQDLDAERMLDALRTVPAGDVVLLHACCHNPSGIDPDAAQWWAVAELAAAQRWLPFFDFAYQGFGAGLNEDRVGLEPFLGRGLDLLVASSFSKNFGLYNERVGALTLLAAARGPAEAAFSQIKTVIRTLYSNPPAHGAALVAAIAADGALRQLWEDEVTAMRNRINGVRALWVERLRAAGAPRDFGFVARQRGMFSFSGLTDAQVQRLRDEKAIYMVGGGRVNVAGITAGNLDYLCGALVEVLRS